MTSLTHHITTNTANQCILSNLSITYEMSVPSDEQSLILTSPRTATDLNRKKCVLLVGTMRVSNKVVMADYPIIEMFNNITLCNDEHICHSVLEPFRPCLLPSILHIEHDRLTVFPQSSVKIMCKMSSTENFNHQLGLTFIPQPLCQYQIATQDLVFTIAPVPTYTKFVLDTELHFNESFILHNATLS